MSSSEQKSQTDRTRVKREVDADTPIVFNPEDELYDPNDDAAVEAYWKTAKITRGRGPQKAPTKEMISIRLSREVLDYFRATGEGWQGRIDEMLKQAIRRKR
jgi:uncharacterized protein (DUF4415 family)